MKHIKSLLSKMALVALAAFAVVACKKPVEPEIEYEHPFTSISFTIGSETIVGDVTADKKIKATFIESDDFSSVKINMELNPGYTVTFPTDLDNADFSKSAVINFTDKNNAVIKYYPVLSSNKFPLKDITKVKINDLELGEALTLENAAKNVIISFDKDIMDKGNIVLTFEDGAVNEGISIPEAVFNFDKGSLVKDLVFKAGDVEIPYTVTLDVAKYFLQEPNAFNFQDITAQFVDEAAVPFIKVMRSDNVVNIPVFDLTDGGWIAENQFFWDGRWFGDADSFAFLGDWAPDRKTYSVSHPLIIVELDQEFVKGNIVYDGDNGVDVKSLNNLVAVSGPGARYVKNVYLDKQFVRDNSAEGELQADPDKNFGGAMGITEDGEITFVENMWVDGSTIKKMPLVEYTKEDFMSEDTNWDNYADITTVREAALQSAKEQATDWDINSAVNQNPFGYINGKALNRYELLVNSGVGFGAEGAFSNGWNAIWSRRVVIGRTWNNKVAIILDPKNTGEDYSKSNPPYDWNPCGYSYPQLCWLGQQLGLRDVFPLAFSSYGHGDLYINVQINGKAVFDNDKPGKSGFAITFDKK